MEKKYNRAAQDIGNTVGIGHVNVRIDDQHKATHFYVTGLGYTRDPFLNTGAGNMWINVGMSQFHLPMGKPDVLRGTTGLVMPDRRALLERLNRVKKALDGTKFQFRESNDGVETVCPWGNRITVHEPDVERFGRVQLGMPYVRFDVRPGTAEAHRALLSRGAGRAVGGEKERRRAGGESPGRREPVFLFPRDRQAGGAVRRRPRPDLSGEFLAAVPQAARSRPDHHRRQ